MNCKSNKKSNAKSDNMCLNIYITLKLYFVVYFYTYKYFCTFNIQRLKSIMAGMYNVYRRKKTNFYLLDVGAPVLKIHCACFVLVLLIIKVIIALLHIS